MRYKTLDFRQVKKYLSLFLDKIDPSGYAFYNMVKTCRKNKGEKINGLWHFTPEQVETFIRHPAVRPSILAKNNGLVYDFLLDNKKAKQEMCMILDIPDVDRETVAEFFCHNICEGDFSGIQFSFDGVAETARVILKGNSKEVMQLVNDFHSKYNM